MQPDFWLNRWQNNQTGFHLPDVNPLLVKYLTAVKKSSDKRVLVPLCGKTLDLVYLAESFATVIGIELAEKAILEFFEEQKLEFLKEEKQGAVYFSAKNLTLIQADIFNLDRENLPEIDLVYDRAALVALKEEQRLQYCHWLTSITGQGGRQLLISFSYNQNEMDGPPFSVKDSQIEQYYGESWQIEKLVSNDILKSVPRFAERGLSSLLEEAYRLTRL